MNECNEAYRAYLAWALERGAGRARTADSRTRIGRRSGSGRGAGSTACLAPGYVVGRGSEGDRGVEVHNGALGRVLSENGAHYPVRILANMLRDQTNTPQ